MYDADAPALGVRVLPSGRASFFVREAVGGRGGRRGFVTLGTFGAVTIADARKLAAAAAGVRATAGSAAAARDARRASVRSRVAAPMVAELADAFLVEGAAKLKASTVAEYRRLLGLVPVRRGPDAGAERAGELRAALGRHKVADVTRAQVAALHLGMKTRPYMANRALAALSALFTYAERHGHRPDGSNPCRHVAPYPEHKRERYLTDDEFAALGAALATAERAGLPAPPTARTTKRRRATPATAKHRTKATAADGARAPAPANPVAIAVLRFLLLSGWREREALTLRWDAVDLGRGVATLADTKTGRSVRELGAPALAVVDAMRAHRQAGNPYVFPGAKPGAHFTDTARVWDAARHAAGLAEVRLHDLRHAFASVAASGGLTLPLIGALLGHMDSATTARYAHLVDSSRKRAAELTSGAVAAALAGRAPASEGASGARLLRFARPA
ncbi:hypothetical protein tb265_26240 [Gemmatimonadetes bacterium T265]|nr:hypothetical protein tb265_26240 [Gemmatimonadetes bacterium T265]